MLGFTLKRRTHGVHALGDVAMIEIKKKKMNDELAKVGYTLSRPRRK